MWGGVRLPDRKYDDDNRSRIGVKDVCSAGGEHENGLLIWSETDHCGRGGGKLELLETNWGSFIRL